MSGTVHSAASVALLHWGAGICKPCQGILALHFAQMCVMYHVRNRLLDLQQQSLRSRVLSTDR